MLETNCPRTKSYRCILSYVRFSNVWNEYLHTSNFIVDLKYLSSCFLFFTIFIHGLSSNDAVQLKISVNFSGQWCYKLAQVSGPDRKRPTTGHGVFRSVCCGGVDRLRPGKIKKKKRNVMPVRWNRKIFLDLEVKWSARFLCSCSDSSSSSLVCLSITPLFWSTVYYSISWTITEKAEIRIILLDHWKSQKKVKLVDANFRLKLVWRLWLIPQFHYKLMLCFNFQLGVNAIDGGHLLFPEAP